MLVTVFPSAVSDSNADQGENGTNTITVTPTPSPEPAPSAAAIATYTPIPKDECQQSFDRLWSFYMADFINNGPHNLEDAEATSDALIDSIWLTTTRIQHMPLHYRMSNTCVKILPLKIN